MCSHGRGPLGHDGRPPESLHATVRRPFPPRRHLPHRLQPRADRRGRPGRADHADAVADAPAPPAIPAPELAPQERYDGSLWTAVSLLTERKYPEALAALEQAQRVQDTEQVRREIAKVKLRLDAVRTADRTARDIQTVLTDGKPDEAARLAAAALREFGDSEAAETITRLKRQADALLTVQLDAHGPDRPVPPGGRGGRPGQQPPRRGPRLRTGGGRRRRGRPRPARRTPRRRLTRYDDGRRRAAELRRDSARLDDALAALRDAAAAWDTPQVRQEIDECTLALQSRRERIGVADFETRGDVGAPLFGRTVAEELLPAFKTRFDVVERGQVAKVFEDLKLQGADLIDHDAGRRELARLARVRYLVVGSVTRLGGVTAHARLLDLQTGLVVQTGKVAAPTPEAARAAAAAARGDAADVRRPAAGLRAAACPTGGRDPDRGGGREHPAASGRLRSRLARPGRAAHRQHHAAAGPGRCRRRRLPATAAAGPGRRRHPTRADQGPQGPRPGPERRPGTRRRPVPPRPVQGGARPVPGCAEPVAGAQRHPPPTRPLQAAPAAAGRGRATRR